MILRDRDMRNRAITVVVIILIFLGAFIRMNTRFDRLSRYPYQDKQARKLIDEYLDDDAVNYIIEYAIEPSYFIDLIEAPGFNIYHVEYYRALMRDVNYLTKYDIVAFAEETGILSGANQPLDISVGELALILANADRVFLP